MGKVVRQGFFFLAGEILTSHVRCSTAQQPNPESAPTKNQHTVDIEKELIGQLCRIPNCSRRRPHYEPLTVGNPPRPTPEYPAPAPNLFLPHLRTNVAGEKKT